MTFLKRTLLPSIYLKTKEMGKVGEKITSYLDEHPYVLMIYGFVTGLTCYFSMYAYRKPFTVIKYNQKLWRIDYKILLLITQSIGYTLSKFYGVYFVSKLTRVNRGLQIFLFISFSLFSWFLFALIPIPYNFPLVFFSAFPLGVIWGLVFSFMEGRAFTEMIVTGMSVSQIISSGFIKTVGSLILKTNIPDKWMPFIVGLIFYFPLGLCCVLLELLPPPSQSDKDQCSERKPMNVNDQKKFIRTFLPGFICLVVSYVIMLVYRDLRDNFAMEIWKELGYNDTPSIYTTSEVIVAFAVVVPVSLTLFIKSKYVTFFSSFGFIILSCVFLISFTILYNFNFISGTIWMVSCGVGLYSVYVPYNTVVFETFLSTFEYPANAGFLTYTSDSFGYLLCTITLLIKNFAAPQINWLEFMRFSSYIIFSIIIAFKVVGVIYFYNKYKNKDKDSLLKMDKNIDELLLETNNSKVILVDY